jgi:hypothetical protein
MFRTKKAALEHFRAMLARYRDGQAVEGEDDADLRGLLTRHPEVERKVGVGVDGFYVDKALLGTRCFYLRRLDGSTTDFSFISCVNGRAPTPHQEFMQAARLAVQEQLRHSKVLHFEKKKGSDGRVPCDLTGRPLLLEEAHLDHSEPMTFEVIVKAFLAARGITNPEEHVTDGADHQFVASFKDQKLADDFREFHKQLAILRWIAKDKNLSLGPKSHLRHRKATVRLTD